MNDLTNIGKKYGTDKAGPQHNYTEAAYYDILKDLRYEKIKLLELGVGDTGASVKMWREFLPNAEIILFDPFFIQQHDVTVTPEELEDLNISVVMGNQLSREDLSKLSSGDKYDIIIDDASHISDGIQISLAFLFPYLKNGGVYIVEDLHCARDRDRRLHQVNAWLDSDNVDQNINKTYHREEVHLLDSLIHCKQNSYWKSLLLNDQEREYLVKNIKEYEIFKDYNSRDNLVIIKKV